MTSMKLEMMAEEDVKLRVRQETDPQMMAELGGPRPREAIERAHAKSLALAAEGRCWPLKIIPDGASSPAGGVDVFESSHDDEAIYEIGWMILPEFQNRGIASQAVREVLEKARVERKFGQIHAFPAVTNGPSNKICEKNGFTNLGGARSSSPGGVFAATTGSVSPAADGSRWCPGAGELPVRFGSAVVVGPAGLRVRSSGAAVSGSRTPSGPARWNSRRLPQLPAGRLC